MSSRYGNYDATGGGYGKAGSAAVARASRKRKRGPRSDLVGVPTERGVSVYVSPHMVVKTGDDQTASNNLVWSGQADDPLGLAALGGDSVAYQVYPLNSVRKGPGSLNRKGARYQCLGVWLQITIYNYWNPFIQTVQVDLVWDWQPLCALASIRNIFSDSDDTGFTNREWAARFLVIKSWRVALTGSLLSPFLTGREVFTYDGYVPLPDGLVTQHKRKSVSGDIGTIVNGALYLCLRAAVGPVVVAGVMDRASLLTMNSRVEFIDV